MILQALVLHSYKLQNGPEATCRLNKALLLNICYIKLIWVRVHILVFREHPGDPSLSPIPHLTNQV